MRHLITVREAALKTAVFSADFRGFQRKRQNPVSRYLIGF